MLESSIRIGTVAGIRVGVHYTWFIIFALIAFSLNLLFQETYPDWARGQAIVTAVITALLFFASIVLHELGHSIVAIRRGIPVRSITLFIFGGVAQTESDAESAGTEFLVAIAGPMVSLLLAVLFYLLSILVQGISVSATAAFEWLSSINLIVALFNLVPGFPLDGGRVFRSVVWGVTGDAVKGMKWAVLSGRLVAFGLLALGALVVLTTGMLLNGIWLAAIGWFLLSAAEASARDFTLRRLLRDVRVGDIMQRHVPTIAGGMSVRDWIDDCVLATAQRAALVEGEGGVTGLVTLSDCGKVPREQWPEVAVERIMTPAGDLHVVSPTAGVSRVLQMMERHSVNQIPVVDGGRTIGWIDRDRLLKTIQLYGELGR